MTNAEAVGVLPTWDLADLYSDSDSDDIRQDVSAAAAAAKLFAKTYQGRVATLQPSVFSEAIETYEGIHESLGRVASYAQLLHAGDLTDPGISKFAQDIREQINGISTDLIFFTLEINRLEGSVLAGLVAVSPNVINPRPIL